MLWGIAPRRGKTSLYFLRETNSANGLVIDKTEVGILCFPVSLCRERFKISCVDSTPLSVTILRTAESPW